MSPLTLVHSIDEKLPTITKLSHLLTTIKAKNMKSTLVLVLLLALCCQLARANEEKAEPEDTTGEVEADDEPVDDILRDVAEKEAKLMSRYSELLTKQGDGPNGQANKQQAGWFSQLFRFGKGKTKEARLADDYRKINDELVKRTSDLSVEKNFDTVLQWYQAEGKDDQQLADALGLLVSLAELTGDNQCNLHSERVLQLNNVATERRAWLKGEEGKRNRVDNIVRFFMLQHADECRDVYKRKFKEIMDGLGDETKAGVRGMMTDDYVANVASDNHQIISYMIAGSDLDATDGKEFREARDKLAKDVFSNLRQVSMKNKSRKFIDPVRKAVNEKNLNKLMDENLFRPCKDYVAHLGPDVYIPWSFDLTVSDSFFKQEMSGDIDVKFALGVTRFEVCQFVLRDQKPFRAQVLELATKAAKA